MNLLDTASLVVTPNGYKASKLYSIIPSDGTGDMTFARTGDTATRVNSSGLIETVLANKPRLDYTSSTCPKLLLEPQRTNLILQSQDISSASWNKFNSPTIVSNSAVAPDGTTTADSIQATDATNFKFIYQGFSVSANSTNTFSFFVKKETTKTYFGGVEIYLSGGTSKDINTAFDEVNGTLGNLNGNDLTPIYKVDDYGTYWRFNISFTDNGSNTTATIYIFGTYSVNGTTKASGAGSARTIWGMQLEAGSYATSYIPTTTASVTRNADVCLKTSATALIGQTQGTLFAHFDSSTLLNGGRIFAIGDGTNNNRLFFYIESTGKIWAVTVTSGSVQLNLNTNINYSGNHKVAFAYANNSYSIYIDGVLISSGTTFSVPACSSIYLGIDELGFNLYPLSGGIKSAALWKTRLQNSELATLTSL